MDAQDLTVDNCHFFGCGAVGAQIIEDAGGPSDVSVTRCTDQSLINNITSPGGNVEYDAACRLFVSVGVEIGFYIAGNSTRDMYFVNQADPNHGSNGGEQISVEDKDGNYPITENFVIYQNTLAGDGAESFISNSSGVTIAPGTSVVIAGNDISNVVQGLHLYNDGYMTEQPFGVYTDNSIHNVFEGFFLQLTSDHGVNNAPWFIGNVFSHNLINGIIDEPGSYAETPAAFVVSYALQDTSIPQAMQNIFYGNIITGAAAGIVLINPTPVPIGATIITGNFFSSDGSGDSYEIYDQAGVIETPVIGGNDIWQGFWLLEP